MGPERRRLERGFSIIELLIVLVIVVILLAIAIPQFGRVELRPVAAPDSVVAPNASGPLTVRVTGWRGRPVPGVTVRFEATGRGGAVTPTSAVTDSAGRATTTWIVRDTSTSAVFVAAVEGQRARIAAPVRVSATRGGTAVPPATRRP
ncbi:MAG: Ig-like domain-containing protein [Gemmatimonadota bacterium]|nr:Ig-like domain-containing protein [Gemmatimonadota bacterium]